nr:serine protease 7 [Helicoverpa armigera]
MKRFVTITFIAVTLIATVAAEACDKCVKADKCAAYGKLSKAEQDAWQIKYPCASPDVEDYSKLFGYAPISKGDYVCCSKLAQGIKVGSRHPNYNYYGNPNDDDDDSSPEYNDEPNSQSPDSEEHRNKRQNNNGWGSDNGNDNGYQNPNYGYNPPKNYFNTNNNPYVTSSPFFPAHGHGNGGISTQGQCPVTSFPPKPETGCCGREASDSDRIIDKPKPPSYYDNGPRRGGSGNSYDSPGGWSSWMPKQHGYGSQRRVRRSDTPDVSIGDRIAGGRETELEQFPWTVLLEITFDYGDKRQGFNCGGSLLSSKYVLTAGHCVFDQGGKIVDIDIYLAEYDKRTFPKDCKNVLGQGQKCIENVVMKAEHVALHPQYDDTHLNNDIALIRIQGNAPYTDYIRPICLPTIDIDSPDFSNLRLAVAGWGRNGRYRSDVKQSTIVNLVPQAKCKKFYPSLSRRQMCAAGYTGEDTCKGDSGGPLMTLYGGKYEVVGVVSGKRADSPCGTSVPSLYTNVYHYRDWIRSNMQN